MDPVDVDSLNLRSEGMSLVQERMLGAAAPAFRGRVFFRNFPYKVGPGAPINGRK